MANERFFAELPPIKDFAELGRLEFYRPLPSDWWVALADIKGSTRALEAGRYKDVNVVSAAAITAVLNAVRPLPVPFVFGGDGVSLCVPGSLVEPVAAALSATRRLALARFGLELRVGMIVASEILQAGRQLMVARFTASTALEQALFIGGGLQWAEERLKDSAAGQSLRAKVSELGGEGDFSGLECRWQHIRSPRGDCMALLVQSADDDATRSTALFREVLEQIAGIYGESAPNPITADALKLSHSPRDLLSEARVRSPDGSPLAIGRYLGRAWALNFAGRFLMARGHRSSAVDWGRYKQDFVENSDYRKCDDMLRLIIPGSAPQHDALESYLGAQQKAGRLYYGNYRAPEVISTCLVFSHQRQHLHFIDTISGGYAKASGVLKQARRQQVPHPSPEI